MGGPTQWQRLARLIDEARARADAAAQSHADAAAQLDVAEYDLKQIARTLEDVMRGVDASKPPAEATAPGSKSVA